MAAVGNTIETPAITAGSESTAPEGEYEYYYCMTYEQSQREAVQLYVLTMLKLGLEVKEILSSESLNFIRISAPIRTIRDYAIRHDIDILCDENRLKEHQLLANMHRAHNPKESLIEPFKYIYMDYQPNKVPEAIYWRPEKLSSPFRSLICLKLTHLIIEAEPPAGYERISLSDSLYDTGVLRDFFPIHDKESLKNLTAKLITWRRLPWRLPFHDIKVKFKSI